MNNEDDNMWKYVPNVNGEIMVSDNGLFKAWETKNKRWSTPFDPSARPSGYKYFTHRGVKYSAHQLVALTFHGPPPTTDSTPDHIAKYDGDWIRERGDNRASNIRWASKRQQRSNQKTSRPRADSKPVAVWKVGESEETAIVYHSTASAAKALGLDERNLKTVAQGRRPTIKGFKAIYKQRDEPDKIHEDEEFRLYQGFSVSQYGRVLSQSGLPMTPKNFCGPYAAVQRGEIKNKLVHHLVAGAWPEIVGTCPGLGYTVDHKDRNTHNNSATNLRWATERDQKLNQTRQDRSSIGSRRKLPTEVKAPGEDFKYFGSIHEAAEYMSLKLHRKVKDSTLSRVLSDGARHYEFKKRNANGWIVRFA